MMTKADSKIKQDKIDYKLVDTLTPAVLAEGALGRLLVKFEKYRAIEDDLGAWMDSPVTVNADYGPVHTLAHEAFTAAIEAKQAMARFTNAIARYGHSMIDEKMTTREA